MTAQYGRSDPGSASFTGDERGYVVGISTCSFDDDGGVKQQPLLEDGDVIRVTATYRTDLWFNGVMGLADLAILPKEEQLGEEEPMNGDNLV